MTGQLTGVAAGHEGDHKGPASNISPRAPSPTRAGAEPFGPPTAEILSFARGEAILRPPGTRTANLWRRNRRFMPSPSDVYTPPEPMRA